MHIGKATRGGRSFTTAAALAAIVLAAVVLAAIVLAVAVRLPAVMALAAPSLNAAASLAGRWDATVVVNGVEIPFRFDIVGDGDDVKGAFFDGDTRITSRPGTFKDGALTLVFDQYAARLEATLNDSGQLEGKYSRSGNATYTFRARRFVQPAPVSGKVPNIAGIWTITLDGTKSEKAWRLIVRQSGAEVSAAVLRVDGDTGRLTGSFRDGTLVLSHFSGARPSIFEVTPKPDGTLEIIQDAQKIGQSKYTAVRVEDPRAKNLARPADPALHTRVKDPNERFRFSFKDLDGKTVTEMDPRLQGKVVLVSITGSWCPNCRDEAPFLVNLYKKYRSRGFEIVALSFEEADQLANPTRVRAFINEFGITYPVLLAGEPEQLTEKVPQAENLNSFPTAFLLGRDGKVRAVHAGFPSPASGKFFTDAQRDLTAEVERLLAERPRPTGTH